ncbi:unnamed protein product [Rotaria socialis]|uniref:Chitin-binding type-2 domain-containing protein n=1 Tax=Rotaria socialis TaxID=392032 RepID=A0A818UE29_9BILA|nr:unnamed protein product [Rotaria socialis]
MENDSMATNEEYCHSSRKSSVKRLSDNISRKQLLFNLPVMNIPEMSEQALKRWCEARDTYLDQRYPSVEKQKYKSLNNEETPSISILDAKHGNEQDVPRDSFDKQNIQTIADDFKDQCTETDANKTTLFNRNIEQIDQSSQVDLLFSQVEIDDDNNNHNNSNDTNLVEDRKEKNDKAIETDYSTVTIKNENGLIHENVRGNSSDLSIDQSDDNDSKTIMPSRKSNISAYEQFLMYSYYIFFIVLCLIRIEFDYCRLRHRFKRLSQERRLLSCLLVLYIIIMCGLFVVIFLLLLTFNGHSQIFYEQVTSNDTSMIHGVAQYGESCSNDNDCRQPFTCYKKGSTWGICRCPWKHDLVNNECVGDLNALCSRDADCQRYMLCSGTDDGTRRCHCQTLYSYDLEQKRCYGDYRAPCQSNNDCRTNLICNTTTIPSMCLCQLNYRYYPLVRKCRGDPGSTCEAATTECADNAECRDGACECAFQFVPDGNKLCVDPCLKITPKLVKIRYPGHCHRFIDCQRRSKSECPEMTIFNFRTQLCDYPKNVLDCQ